MLIVISSPNKSDARKMDQRTCAIKEPAADLLVSWITALVSISKCRSESRCS